MRKEPDNLVLKLLREMRTKLDEVFAKLQAAETRVRRIESQLDDLWRGVTYALGWSGAAVGPHGGGVGR
jgi:hypothetical protein